MRRLCRCSLGRYEQNVVKREMYRMMEKDGEIAPVAPYCCPRSPRTPFRTIYERALAHVCATRGVSPPDQSPPPLDCYSPSLGCWLRPTPHRNITRPLTISIFLEASNYLEGSYAASEGVAGMKSPRFGAVITGFALPRGQGAPSVLTLGGLRCRDLLPAKLPFLSTWLSGCELVRRFTIL
jgi:hypothetical protein